MTNQCNVLYTNPKGIVAFKGKKVVFQDRKIKKKKELKPGLGIIKKDSLIDKQSYFFADLENVKSFIPKKYPTISFFEDIGVPIKIEKGYYGDNVFLRETTQTNVIIKAYNFEGKVIFYENKIIKKVDYEGRNVYYNRINELIGKWEDITKTIHDKVFEGIYELEGVPNILREKIIEGVENIIYNEIYQLENGVILAEGEYEHLLIWGNKNEDKISMAWLGKKLKFDRNKAKNITEELKKSYIEKRLKG